MPTEMVRTYKVEENFCNLILSRVNIPDQTKITYTGADIPELAPIIKKLVSTYISETNITEYANLSNIKIENLIYFYPPRTTMNFLGEHSKNIKVFIHLVDSESITEVYNTFTDTTIRVKPKKGDVIIFPACWLILQRHTSTKEGVKMFINSTVDIL